MRLVFREDLRLEEVRRCLQSSKPVRVALTQRPEVRWVGVVWGGCVGVVGVGWVCGCVDVWWVWEVGVGV